MPSFFADLSPWRARWEKKSIAPAATAPCFAAAKRVAPGGGRDTQIIPPRAGPARKLALYFPATGQEKIRARQLSPGEPERLCAACRSFHPDPPCRRDRPPWR